MPAVPPKLTDQQRRDALIKADKVRSRRAVVKKEMRAGKVNFQDLLDLAVREEALAGMKVLTALESIPGIGKVKARRKLKEINVSEVRRIKGLNKKQTKALQSLFIES